MRFTGKRSSVVVVVFEIELVIDVVVGGEERLFGGRVFQFVDVFLVVKVVVGGGDDGIFGRIKLGGIRLRLAFALETLEEFEIKLFPFLRREGGEVF